jgi:hypothetical protein
MPVLRSIFTRSSKQVFGQRDAGELWPYDAFFGAVKTAEGNSLIGDPMLQLPDPKCGEQQTFGPGKCPDCGQIFLGGAGSTILPRTTPAGLGFTDAACAFTEGEVTGVVHAGSKKQLPSQ